MRATGFGIKSPKEATGDFLFPKFKSDGTCLIMSHKTIMERRREMLYLFKM